jgi:hypothetical protein
MFGSSNQTRPRLFLHIFISVLLVLASISTFTNAEARSRIYSKDYMVTCRDDGSCEAINFKSVTGPEGTSYHHIEFYRPPNTKSNDWLLSLALIVDPVMPDTSVKLTTDNRSWELWDGTHYINEHGTLHILPTAGTEILNALRNGNFLRVSYQADHGQQMSYRHSVRGLKKALSWINRQKKIKARNYRVVAPTAASDSSL